MEPTMKNHEEARRNLIQALAVLTFPAAAENTLAAKNLQYHAEELCRSIDVYYSGRDPDDPALAKDDP